MKIYLAGPMTGYERHNIAAFTRATGLLRKAGLTVVSPAELHVDDDDFSNWLARPERWSDDDIPTQRPFEWYLKRDLRAMLDCDKVMTLPGWGASRGANLEVETAKAVGMKIVDYVDWLEYQVGIEQQKATFSLSEASR